MTFPAQLELANLDGSNGFALNGIDEGDCSGRSVAGAGDINGDGFDDFLIGATDASPNGSFSGQSYVVFGQNSGFAPELELANLDGSNGFALNGINADDISGRSVAGAGDINGDGFDDILIGASFADPNGYYSGESYVVFGQNSGFRPELELANLDGSNGFALNGINANDKSGLSVAGVGDINGDGFDDFLIGAPDASPNGYYSGQSYVVFGDNSGFAATIELSSLDGSNGFALNGVNVLDSAGYSVAGAGDINGDRIDDLLLGAPFADSNGSESGQSYVVFGQRHGFAATIELSSLDGTNGFTLNGINADDKSGNSVSGAGDINGDGFDDFLIGAWGSDANGADAGQSYVVFGHGNGFQPTIELSSLDGSNGFVLNGISPYDVSGNSVSGAGDINGDGFDDLLLGAPHASPNGSESGQSYVVFGHGNGFQPTIELSSLDGSNGFALNGIHGGDFSGYSVAGAGDINGDGFDDILLGAPDADPNNLNSGQSYLVFGKGKTLSQISINDVTVLEGLNRQAQLTLSLSEADTSRIQVNYSTMAGSAEAGSDFQARNGLVTFRPGETTKTISIPIVNNNFSEADETFTVELNNPTNGAIADGQGLVTISDTLEVTTTTTLPLKVENLTLIGKRIINGTGNNQGNIITGNTKNNVLKGSQGDDHLIGNDGKDILIGDRGDDLLTGDAPSLLPGRNPSDRFSYNSGRPYRRNDFGTDTITDLTSQDKIVLSKTTFTALESSLGNGFSEVSDYRVVPTDTEVASSSGVIVFSQESSTLSYNQNGDRTGLGSGSPFAILEGVSNLPTNRFIIEA